MNITPATVVLAALSLTACDPPVDGNVGDYDAGRPGNTTADEAIGRESSTRGSPATATGNVPMSVRETALQYQARKSKEGVGTSAGTQAVRYVVACAACHGPQGGGNLALRAPKIGGLEAWYIARQLKLFHQGLRGGTDDDPYGTYMRSSVLLVNEDGIEELAEHFAALDPEPLQQVVDGDVDRGEALFTVCTACHGQRAEGNATLNTPSLIGQSGPYMVRQLENYRTGLRGAEPADVFGQQMLPIVKSTLTSRQDSVDVVAYIESLDAGSGSAGGASGQQSGQ